MTRGGFCFVGIENTNVNANFVSTIVKCFYSYDSSRDFPGARNLLVEWRIFFGSESIYTARQIKIFTIHLENLKYLT